MNDAVLGQLLKAMETHAPQVYQNSQITSSLLHDLLGSDRYEREISALAGAVQHDIPDMLIRASRGPLPPTLGERLSGMLRGRLAMDDEAARWAVRTWASALGITGLRLPGATSAGPGVSPGPTAEKSLIARLAHQAAKIATSIPVENAKSVALSTAATMLAVTDTGNAGRLLDEAQLLVSSLTSENAKTAQRHDMAVTVAGTNPDRAEHLALSVRGLMRDDALGHLASVLADSDPDRALRLAWSIGQEDLKMYALGGLAATIASLDPERAVRLARSLTGEYWKAEALCHVAAAVAIEDPDRAAALLGEAEGHSRSVTDDGARVAALSSIAKVLDGTEPGRAAQLFDEADQLAQSVTDEAVREPAIGSLAVALAARDPDRALALTQSLTDSWYPIGEIAITLANAEPGRALSVAQSITDETPHLADVAVALAVADPDGALRFAWAIKDERVKNAALTGIARTLAAAAPDRARRILDDVERFVQQMPDDLDKVVALADLAGV